MTLCLFVTSCAQEESLDSWEASTIEECIQEKACAWRAFKETVLDTHGLWEHSNKRAKIAKWQGDIHVGFWGDFSLDTKEIVQEAKHRIEPYFPYDIAIQKPPNFIILLVDDFEKKTIDQFRPEIQNFTGMDDERYRLFSNVYKPKAVKCSDTKLAEGGNRTGFLIMANRKQDKVKECIISGFFKSAGLRQSGPLRVRLDDYPIEQKSMETITDLHLVVLKIFYDQNFPEIVDYHTAKQAFLDIYPKVLKEYNAAKTGE